MPQDDDLLLEPWPRLTPNLPTATPHITKAIAEATDRVTAARVVHQMIREGRVTNLATVADRIKTKKAAYEKKAEDWAKRLDALDQREPNAFAAGDAAVESQETDLGGMEEMMRGLSNLPNGSAKS